MSDAPHIIYVTDDEILSLWRTVSPSPDQNTEMTYQSGPYDIECPTWELRRLVELAVEHGFKLASNTLDTPKQT